MRSLLIAAAIVLLSQTPAAARFCYEPSAPSCADDFGPFADQYDYDNCRDDLEDFATEVDDYVLCLRRSQEDALDAYNQAVDDFNDRVNS